MDVLVWCLLVVAFAAFLPSFRRRLCGLTLLCGFRFFLFALQVVVFRRVAFELPQRRVVLLQLAGEGIAARLRSRLIQTRARQFSLQRLAQWIQVSRFFD